MHRLIGKCLSIVVKQTKAPSSGEANAISGYWKQYEYSASVIFRLMQNGVLEAVSISDPAAGIFDDLVVHTKGVIQAIQVKTEKNATYVSLATELKDDKIKAMADAWSGLRTRYGTEDVRLRYIFPGLFSKNDTALASGGTSGARHSAEFAAFVSNRDLSKELIEQSIWSTTLADLQARSGLGEEDFIKFLCHLEFSDERELLANRLETFQPADRDQVEAIRSLLPVLISTSSAGQKWSEQELVDKLGWRSRITQYNVHIFPVPPDYQQNDATEQKLVELIDKTNRGYVALVGPPGTGKSTLLQRGIHSTAEYAVSRYLAFHPDQRHGLGRAEAGEFLNDLIAELRSQGLYASKFASEDLPDLRKEFSKQLASASARFSETARKTLIVIDGLDHVPREETPAVSFLSELPASSAIPEGVVIVLGTQRIELPGLHPTIIQQSKAAGRTISIDPLSKAAVFSLADAAGLGGFVDRELLYRQTGGHPLTARYYVEALKAATNEQQAGTILSDTTGLGQSLEDIYERVWTKLDTASSSRRVLAILARSEGTLSADQLAGVTDDQSVEDVLATAGYLLSQHSKKNRLSIFHNSFRLFVANATGKRFGQPSAELEASLNALLADIARAADVGDPQHWFQLRYWSRAGNHEEVLALGTAEYFRRSLRVFRPPSEIYADLRLTYAAVKPTGNRTLLLNRLLIEKEIDYRLEAVRELDVVGLLMDLGDIELATGHALASGDENDGWLRLVDYYWDRGEVEKARLVFEANEPLDSLFSSHGSALRQEPKFASEWAERAQRFRPLEKLVTLLDSLSPEHQDDDEYNERAETRDALKLSLALGSIRDGRVTNVQALVDVLKLNEEHAACVKVQAAESAYDAGLPQEAATYLTQLSDSNALSGIHSSWRRAAAFLALNVGDIEFAKSVSSSLTIPRLDQEDPLGSHSPELPHVIIETAFLASKLGISITEDAKTTGLEESVLLSSAQIKLRELGAMRAIAETRDAAVTAKALRTVILFFAQATPDAGDYRAYRFFSILGSIAEFILEVASEAGEDVYHQIVSFIDGKLSSGDNNLSRSEDFRLDFSKRVFEIDRNADAARFRIDQLRPAAIGRTPQEAVASHVSTARAYCQIGYIEEARKVLEVMHQDTLGYWLRAKKEPQYQLWTWAFQGACQAAPSSMEDAALRFAQFVLGMDETEGDETAARVLPELLEGAGVSPRALGGVLDRLLTSNLSTWARIAELTLVSVVKQEPQLAGVVLIACSSLVLPFASGGIEDLLQSTLPAMSPSERAGPIEVLLHSIERWCPPSKREIILDEIVKFAPEARPAVDAVLSASADLSAKLDRLRHGDPSQLTQEKGTSIDIDVNSLSELIDHGDGKSDYGDRVDYSYARAAERLVCSSSKSQLENFLSKRPNLKADAKFMAEVARRFLNLGHRSDALRFFTAAERSAYSGHWSRFLGGEKLAVQRVRLELYGKPAAIQAGFDILLDELSSGQTSGSSLFLNMGMVLELITDPLPSEEFWEETEQHLVQYREFRLADPVTTIDSIQSHLDVVAFLVAKAFSFSCPEVTQHARRAAQLIAQSDLGPTFLEKFLSFLRECPDGPREAVALVHGLRLQSHLQAVVLDEANTRAASDDFVIATLARRTLSDLGANYQQAPTSLPPFYQIATAQSDQAEDFDPAPGLLSGQRPVWSEEPWTWTSIMPRPIKLLALASDVPIETLRRRCALFMSQEGGREAFGPEVEERILQRLTRLTLQFGYRKPMASSCLRAFGKVLQELYSANAVDPRVFPSIWGDVGGPTLSGLRLEEGPRPGWLSWPSFPRRQYGGIETDQWLEQANAIACLPLLPGEFVLAEESIFLVQASNAEADMRRVSLPDYPDPTKGTSGLPRLRSWDDLRPLYRPEESRIVCRLSGNLFDDFQDEAMTICPYLANQMGWSHSLANPLELYDGEKQLVAKTIKWVEGTRQHGRKYDPELFGRGQAVILTEEGKSQLNDLGRRFLLSVKVTATATEENGKVERHEVFAG